MPALDPFHPLLRVVDRYRRDVHQLHPAAAPAALAAATEGLSVEVPASLQTFLARWDGATLFRGALSVRASAQLAPASADAPQVIIFADGPRVRWAYTQDERGGALFGRWRDESEGGHFEPLHERFDRWLHATVRILDEDIRDPDERLGARLDADPDSAWLLLAQARRRMAQGDPEGASVLLHRATTTDPNLFAAWSLLGEAQLTLDPAAARFALLKAVRGLSLPAPWPGAPLPSPETLRAAGRMLPAGDAGWERELVWFLEERVEDTRTTAEARLVEAASVELARNRVSRGDRQEARTALLRHLDAAAERTATPSPTESVLLLATLEHELGEHDEAERHLRRVRGRGGRVELEAGLLLGRIAVSRREPWAESILAEVLAGLAGVPDVPRSRALSAEAHLLLAERGLTRGDTDRAAIHLTEAARAAGDGAADRLRAQISLCTAALHLATGDLPAVEVHLRAAREQSGDDAELLQRTLVLRGDLFAQHGDAASAAADYERAAHAFAGLGLPLAEADAWLRVARLGHPTGADHARVLYKNADHAAGVAQADGVVGDPGLSLGWHLERSAEHARDRANAWRVRPPLTRADADRPERRLGAHRMAIAACDVRVVDTLVEAIDSAGRTLNTATPRMSDPTLTRFIAAADLLAAHRSFDAAEALLRQLLEVRPQGYAGRALVGAMARSPNAALVDGLLHALDGGFDPAGMAAAAEVLGWRREPEAVPVLRRLLSSHTPRTARRAAVVALGRVGDPVAVDDILGLLDEPGLEEEVSTALLLLGEWQGVDSQAQALASRGPRGSASHGEIVGRYGGPSYLLLLIRTAEGEGPAAIGALQGLGYLGDPRAVTHLLGALGSREPTRNRVASVALELITGHHEDPEESLLRSRWMEWWDRNQEGYKTGCRYRHGRLLDPGLLIERLDHDDSLVRRSTYDELVISTGMRLPFDAEGPWRVQGAHRKAWSVWWRDERERYPSGRWFFFGDRIG